MKQTTDLRNTTKAENIAAEAEGSSSDQTLHLNDSLENLTTAIKDTSDINSAALIDINSTLGKIEAALSSSSPAWNGIIIAIVGALSGALAAYLFNRYHWKSTSKRDNVSKLATTLNSQIEKLESFSVAYWLIGYSDKAALKLSAQEIKIKANLKATRHLARSFTKKLEDSKNAQLATEVTNFIDDVYDLITGGEFESKGREASIKIATKISNDCSLIRAKISDFSYSDI